MRILVTGKNGQVDTALQIEGDRLGLDIVRIGRPDVDLSKPDTIEAAVREICPEVIISSAAYTAVDKAESEPDLAQAVNGDAPGVLARLAAELNIPILHLSTDCVFSGEKAEPYTETDTPAPISVYGRTKLSGEEQVRAATDNHVILRISWVYSALGNNFVKMMLHLSETRDEVTVVADQHGCPTYAPEAARAAALEEIRARREEERALPDLNVLGKPPDRRDFLLSALPPQRMAQRLRRRGWLLLAGAALAGLDALWVLQRHGWL